LGALSYQGTWDASTNTPTLTSSVGTKGYYYVVSVAGSTNLNGITDWLVGDWAVYNGTAWQKVDNTDAVTSVNTLTGAVVLTTTNIAEGTNLYYTDVRARASNSAGTGISYDSATGVITNSAPDQTVALTDGTAIDVTGTYPNFTINNTAPDQTVVLTAGTGISTSGTYPNFTITNTSPSAGGDVAGPSSATDNAIARFDTTTGKLIQNSLVIIGDTGSVTGVNALTAESLTVNNNATLGSSNTDTLEVNARITTDLEPNTDAAKDIGTSGRNWRDGFFSRNLQAEGKVVSPHFDALNSAGGQLRNSSGTPQLQWGGGGGNNVSVDVAININPANAQVDLSPTGTGTVRIAPATAGTMNNMVIGGTTPLAGSFTDLSVTGTTSFDGAQGTSGQVLTSAGTGNTPTWTTPTTGTVTSVDATAGTGISVSGGPITTSGSLTITNTAPDQVVSLTGAGTTSISGTYPNFTITSDDQFDGTVTSVDLTAGTGISVSGGPITSSGSITVTNTAPDQTVAISSGTGISVSGTYPNFTVTNTAPSSGGTVTSVTGTAPVVSSGGNTPAISMAAATGSVDGYLTSTDWNTFNNKSNTTGTVTSVGGTGTVNGITLTGTVTSSGNLTLGGTLSGVSLSTQVTGTLPIANGGTGETTRQAAMDALAGAVTSGQYLRGNGTDVVMSAIQAADVPTLNQNTTGTASNVTGTVAIANGGTGQTTANAAYNALSPMTTTGDITYEAAGGIATRLPIGTAGQVLTVASGLPSWAAAGGGGSNITTLGLWENSATISANYTIGTGNNAQSAGPITINTGVTVTVPSGSTWVVV
jgi:hypothetical protein